MLKKAASLILASTLRSGCVGAFIAGAVVGGVVIHEGRNMETRKSDFKITHRINKELGQDTNYSKKSHLVISAYDGVILLAGQTPNEGLRSNAQQIAEKTPGVKRVYNEISVSGPSSPMMQSSDAWIATKVKTKLLATKELDSSQIKVVTEQGVVYLLGKVTRNQAKVAADATRTIAGVQKVVTLFEYLQ